MCEFKVIRQNDNTQIAEEILVLSYNDDNNLLVKDILGIGMQIDSALIMDVNTLTQKCMVFEHPLVKDFMGFMKDLANHSASKEQINALIKHLETIRSSL